MCRSSVVLLAMCEELENCVEGLRSSVLQESAENVADNLQSILAYANGIVSNGKKYLRNER